MAKEYHNLIHTMRAIVTSPFRMASASLRFQIESAMSGAVW